MQEEGHSRGRQAFQEQEFWPQTGIEPETVADDHVGMDVWDMEELLLGENTSRDGASGGDNKEGAQARQQGEGTSEGDEEPQQRQDATNHKQSPVRMRSMSHRSMLHESSGNSPLHQESKPEDHTTGEQHVQEMLHRWRTMEHTWPQRLEAVNGSSKRKRGEPQSNAPFTGLAGSALLPLAPREAWIGEAYRESLFPDGRLDIPTTLPSLTSSSSSCFKSQSLGNHDAQLQGVVGSQASDTLLPQMADTWRGNGSIGRNSVAHLDQPRECGYAEGDSHGSLDPSNSSLHVAARGTLWADTQSRVPRFLTPRASFPLRTLSSGLVVAERGGSMVSLPGLPPLGASRQKAKTGDSGFSGSPLHASLAHHAAPGLVAARSVGPVHSAPAAMGAVLHGSNAAHHLSYDPRAVKFEGFAHELWPLLHSLGPSTHDMIGSGALAQAGVPQRMSLDLPPGSRPAIPRPSIGQCSLGVGESQWKRRLVLDPLAQQDNLRHCTSDFFNTHSLTHQQLQHLAPSRHHYEASAGMAHPSPSQHFPGQSGLERSVAPPQGIPGAGLVEGHVTGSHDFGSGQEGMRLSSELDNNGGERGSEEGNDGEGGDGECEDGSKGERGEKEWKEWLPRRRGRVERVLQGDPIKPRSMAERKRREKISDGMKELRAAIGGQGDSASILEQAVAMIKALQEQAQNLQSVLLLHQSQCSLRPFPLGYIPPDAPEGDTKDLKRQNT